MPVAVSPRGWRCGVAPPTDFRGRSAPMPVMPRHHAHCRVDRATVRDRPDPHAPPHPGNSQRPSNSVEPCDNPPSPHAKAQLLLSIKHHHKSYIPAEPVQHVIRISCLAPGQFPPIGAIPRVQSAPERRRRRLADARFLRSRCSPIQMAVCFAAKSPVRYSAPCSQAGTWRDPPMTPRRGPHRAPANTSDAD